MSETVYPDVDTKRKELVAMLMYALGGRPDFVKKHRKVKTYVFSLHVDALNELTGVTRRSPRECFTLNAGGLEDLLDRALGFSGVGVYQVDGSDSSIWEELDRVWSEIANIDVTKGLYEIYGEKAKKRLKKARQMIDTNSYTMTFVVKDDVIDMVKALGVTDNAAAERRAHRIWGEVCFTLEIYHTDQGEEGTFAEFMCAWLRSGYTWESSIAHLWTLFPTNRKRALSQTFRADAMKRLRTKVAQSYDPQVRAGTEAGEFPS